MKQYKRIPAELYLFERLILCNARTIYFLLCGRDIDKQAKFVCSALLALADD